MSKLSHIALSNFDAENPVLKELYEIFRATLKPDISRREFRVYYFKHKPHLLDISFLKEGEKIIGFICVSFYRHQLGGRKYTICRSAIGILEQYRGGRLPNWLLCWKYMKYKFGHPLETVYLNGFMANPLMYAMICKYTHNVYPKTGVRVTEQIEMLRKLIVQYFGLHSKEGNPFVMKIHFQVHINAADEQRIFKSTDRHVNYYLQLNPHFQQQYGLLTIVPVSWHNISVSIIQAFIIRPVKKYCRQRFKAAGVMVNRWKQGLVFGHNKNFAKPKL